MKSMPDNAGQSHVHTKRHDKYVQKPAFVLCRKLAVISFRLYRSRGHLPTRALKPTGNMKIVIGFRVASAANIRHTPSTPIRLILQIGHTRIHAVQTSCAQVVDLLLTCCRRESTISLQQVYS